jgi:hypothetical protein
VTLEDQEVGLRTQDIYSGLQTTDQTSGLIAAELEATRLTGMAATLASNIKGIDVIEDERALKTIAAHQWGIDSLALGGVLRVLEEVDYITVHRQGRKVVRIDERVPLLHSNLYETLGEQWRAENPTELDEAAVETVDALASAPQRLSELEADVGDPDTVTALLEVGNAAQILRVLELPDGDKLLWSPFCAYENPEALGALFERFENDDVRDQFEQVRKYQGLPLDGSAAVLADAVGHGILIANSIKGSGGEASFAFLPYRAAPEFRHIKKVVLDKALILLAAVRYGQHYAKHPIHRPDLILGALLDPARGALRASTEAKQQYYTAAQNQIIRLERIGSGEWYRPVLIDTDDNRASVLLALDLAKYGEPMKSRDDPNERLLFTGGEYLTPLMTMKERSPKGELPQDVILGMLDNIRGEAA